MAIGHAEDQKPQVKHGAARATSPASGKEMFQAYCASCHGAIAKGDGPAATAPKTPPAHLTTLSQKNGGKIPANRIAGILRGQATVTAHGNQDMAGLGTGVLANKPGA